MAASRTGWSITSKVSQNIEYTHKWAIENFDFAMGATMGEIKSDSFCIPGVPGEFHMVVKKGARDFQKMPTRVKIGDHEFNVKLYFSVSLKSTVSTMKAASKLDVIKEGTETQSGKFGDSENDEFATSFVFRANSAHEYYDLYYEAGHGFYTTGSTSLLNLVARITIPGKVTTLGGKGEEERKKNRLLDFQPLLSNPKHSDIVLKCGDTRFRCHKVVLAAR